MTTFKKRFTIKALTGWLDDPLRRQRCGTAICQLTKLVAKMEEKTKQEWILRVIKCGIRTARCEIVCPNKKSYEMLKLAFLCGNGTDFNWRG